MATDKIDQQVLNLALFAEISDSLSTLYLADAESEYKDAMAAEETRRWEKSFKLQEEAHELDIKSKEQANMISMGNFGQDIGPENIGDDGQVDWNNFDYTKTRWFKENDAVATSNYFNEFYAGRGKDLTRPVTQGGELDITKAHKQIQDFQNGARLGANFSAATIIPEAYYTTQSGIFKGVDDLSPGYFSSNDGAQANRWVQRLLNKETLLQEEVNILQALGIFEAGDDLTNIKNIKADDSEFWNQERRDYLQTSWQGFSSAAMSSANQNYVTEPERYKRMTEAQERGLSFMGAFFKTDKGKLLQQQQEMIVKSLDLPIVDEKYVSEFQISIDGDLKAIDLLDDRDLKKVQKWLTKKGVGYGEVYEFAAGLVSRDLHVGMAHNYADQMDASGNIKSNTSFARLEKQMALLGPNFYKEFEKFKRLVHVTNQIQSGVNNTVDMFKENGSNIPAMTRYRIPLLDILDKASITSGTKGDVTLREALVSGSKADIQKATNAYMKLYKSQNIPDNVAQIYYEQMLKFRTMYGSLTQLQ